MSRYIVIREIGETKVTVVDKLSGTAEEVELESLGLDMDDLGDTDESQFHSGIATAMVIAEGKDFSAQFHYRA